MKWNIYVQTNASRTHLARPGEKKSLCGLTPTLTSEIRYTEDDNYVRGLIKQSVPESPPAYQFCQKCKSIFFSEIHSK